MSDTILTLAKEVQNNWPTKWSNVVVRLFVNELKLGFECDDKDFGTIRVTVRSKRGKRVAYLEGKNKQPYKCIVGYNLKRLDKGLLQECFLMCRALRALREFERTGDIKLAQAFGKHHAKAIQIGV